MINNLSKIKPLLSFNSEDDFYFLQIIKRKKENPDIGSNSVIIQTYYITSIDHLEKLMPEIIVLCDTHNARACLNLNVRSFEKTAFHMLSKVSNIIMNKDYKSVKNAYDSVCGTYSAGREKRWIVDIDTFDETFKVRVRNTIASLSPIGEKVIAEIPTKNGFHLICHPFDMREAPYGVDIHKDNPTLLYI